VDEVLVTTVGPDIVRLSPNRPLRASEYDSIDILDTAARLEQEFDVEFTQQELATVTTRRTLYDTVYRKVRETHGPPGGGRVRRWLMTVVRNLTRPFRRRSP
jgi:acyl carrier protein